METACIELANAFQVDLSARIKRGRPSKQATEETIKDLINEQRACTKQIQRIKDSIERLKYEESKAIEQMTVVTKNISKYNAGYNEQGDKVYGSEGKMDKILTFKDHEALLDSMPPLNKIRAYIELLEKDKRDLMTRRNEIMNHVARNNHKF